MLAILNSPVTQVMIGVVTGSATLALVCGLAGMWACTWMLVGRLSRDDLPMLAGMAGLLVGLASFGIWGFLSLSILSLLPNDWVPFACKAFAWIGVIVVFAAVVGMAMLLPHVKGVMTRRKGVVGERQVSRLLTKLGYEHVDDQFVGGASDVAQVDHIVRVGGVVLVLETKNIEGKLYPKADGSLALHTSDEKNPTTIPDPVRQNERQVRAVRAAGKGIDVRGSVVFTALGEFPQGIPQGCVCIKDLPAYLRLIQAGVPSTPATDEAWMALRHALSELDLDEMRSRHVEMIADNAAARSLPKGTMVCRKCHGGNMSIDYVYSFHWRCDDCKTCSAIRIDAGESLVMDGGILYRESARGRSPVEGQAVPTYDQRQGFPRQAPPAIEPAARQPAQRTLPTHRRAETEAR